MVKYLKWAYEKLWCIFAVAYWLQINTEEASKTFDDWCRAELAKGTEFKSIGDYTAEFGGRTLWIENHPYGSFNLHEKDKPRCSVKRYTKYLLNKRLKECREAHIQGILK